MNEIPALEGVAVAVGVEVLTGVAEPVEVGVIVGTVVGVLVAVTVFVGALVGVPLGVLRPRRFTLDPDGDALAVGEGAFLRCRCAKASPGCPTSAAITATDVAKERARNLSEMDALQRYVTNDLYPPGYFL